MLKSRKSLILTRIPQYLLFCISILIIPSCVTQRKVEYLQDRNKDIKVFNEAEYEDYRLKPNDELFIRINSLDDADLNIFSNIGQEYRYTGSLGAYGASLLSYTVDKEGFLFVPVIGKIPVEEKTISEISELIKDSLNNILNQPDVSVKLVNRYVSVLGEVRNPGHYVFSQEKFTVFDALGFAGDITEYGNRSQAVLIRNEKGINSRINMDLTKSDILTSDYYNLRPNDIVYIKPLRNKFWGMRQFPFSVFFSTITAGLLIYNVMK
jgi:polysaccharide export outer membrane protein